MFILMCTGLLVYVIIYKTVHFSLEILLSLKCQSHWFNNLLLNCLSVTEGCEVGQWSEWGSCNRRNKTCGYKWGLETRTRHIVKKPPKDTIPCPTIAESRRCKMAMRHCRRGEVLSVCVTLSLGLVKHMWICNMSYKSCIPSANHQYNLISKLSPTEKAMCCFCLHLTWLLFFFEWKVLCPTSPLWFGLSVLTGIFIRDLLVFFHARFSRLAIRFFHESACVLSHIHLSSQRNILRYKVQVFSMVLCFLSL